MITQVTTSSDRTILTLRSIECLEAPLELLRSVWTYARPVLTSSLVERVFHCSGRDPEEMLVFKKTSGSGLLFLVRLSNGWSVGEIGDNRRCDGQLLRIIGDVDLGRAPSACLDPRDDSIISLSQQGRVFRCSHWSTATPQRPALWQPIRGGRRISNYMHDIICAPDGALWGLSKPHRSTLPGLFVVSRTSLENRSRRGSITSQEEHLVHCLACAYSTGVVFALRPVLVNGKCIQEQLVEVKSVGVNEIEFKPVFTFEPLWNPWFDVGSSRAFITGRSECMIPILFIFDLHACTIISRLSLPTACTPITRIYTADSEALWGVSVRAREVRKIRLLSN
ncbi:hypothetical protein Pmar_PMAR025654 [Perkinsus marinus ATCC 50983]|uniref:Uncharacterized protein n=1 Tax=Perkinsus marinus (strain ATCC 50983 / TXsc) TaxID=423536 RepID=C5KIM6_PERM5|nr:hypothetical protein Pmar_PMAR025654 [Perkinsus marinus ATCC 50983]EER15641.1 hypothetical protein Pmar_PMAR025654 [Perkinsus marinus ATCC 50983]|eukprot:XP_002783845.1 hypothetical protein Pmar_PMAR025654 [Perkinsus marinus ATCC 50983]